MVRKACAHTVKICFYSVCTFCSVSMLSSTRRLGQSNTKLEPIPAVSEKPAKSQDCWCDASLKDREQEAQLR